MLGKGDPFLCLDLLHPQLVTMGDERSRCQGHGADQCYSAYYPTDPGRVPEDRQDGNRERSQRDQHPNAVATQEAIGSTHGWQASESAPRTGLREISLSDVSIR